MGLQPTPSRPKVDPIHPPFPRPSRVPPNPSSLPARRNCMRCAFALRLESWNAFRSTDPMHGGHCRPEELQSGTAVHITVINQLARDRQLHHTSPPPSLHPSRVPDPPLYLEIVRSKRAALAFLNF